MIIKDFYYKGGCTLISKIDNLGLKYVDDQDTEIKVRIVGTNKEIDKLHKEFMNENKYLYLDEVYHYEVPKKGTYWYNHHCYGTLKEYKETMKKVSSKVKEYNNKYKQSGAFIAN